jgi:hypothetical protein
MTHIRFTEEQIREIYPVLYRKVFEKECENKPDTVLAVPDGDKFKCYLAGYWVNKVTFYIQDAGVLPEYRFKGLLKCFGEALEDFSGVRFLSMTENHNVTAMKTLLLSGFRPIGGKFIDNVYFVEWLLEAKNG